MATLDDLKQRIKDTPIHHIMSHFINVIPKGAAFTALCPFHDDHNPSLHINPTRNSFKCFVDNIGGDAITFVMHYKNLNFVEAMQEICKVMGWPYDEYAQKREVSPKEAMARKVLDAATKLYLKAAWDKENTVFLDFLKQRQLSHEVARTYQLGFAPGNNSLSGYLGSLKKEEERTLALKTAMELGLIRQDTYREGATYDTFRDRIVFPLWNPFGNVMGFTTRATRPEQKAKYMNSPESFMFKKNQLLYGLHLAKPFIKSRDQVLLVEGNMDQIALFKHGFEQTVAIMGIAMSEPAIDRLCDMTRHFVLVFDGDAAGLDVTRRVNQSLLKRGITPLFIPLTGEHKDPDDFLKAHGALAFQRQLDEARPFVDWELEEALPKRKLDEMNEKLEALEDAFKLVAPLGIGLQASERLVLQARKLGLQSSAEEITSSYKAYLQRQRDGAPAKAAREAASTSLAKAKNDEAREQKRLDTPIQFTRGERRLLQEIVQHPECLTHAKFAELLDFVDSHEVKTYVSKLKRLVLEIDDSEYLDFAQNLLNADEHSLELREAVGFALEKFDPRSELNEKVIEKLLGDLKRKLQEDQLKTQQDELKRRQEECTDPHEQSLLLSQLLEVKQQLSQMKKT